MAATHSEPDSRRRQVLINAVSAAVMAPSSHNTQPWRFRISGGALELHADPRRHLTVIDPDRRQLVQSCGCALFNAEVAVRAMGYVPQVTVLPDPADPDLLAVLRPGEPRPPTDEDRALMRALPLRRTNRRRFQARPVGADEVAALAAIAERPGVWLVRLDPEGKRRVAQVIDLADRIQYGDQAFRAELARWLVAAGSRRDDGIPFVEKEYGSSIPFAVMRALRSPDLGADFGRLEEELVRGAPAVLVMGTDGDDARAWLAAGQALEALLLQATARGLSAAFLNQALEIGELRDGVRAVIGHAGHPQMILRLGYPAEPIHHPSPRRDLDDVLRILD